MSPRTPAPAGKLRERLLRAASQGLGIRLLSRTYGITMNHARNIAEEARKQRGEVLDRNMRSECVQAIEATILDKYQEVLHSTSDLVNNLRNTEMTWKPPVGNVPITVAFLADVHLGDAGLAYDRFQTDFNTILTTPNTYCILGGDLIDNHIKHLSACLASGMAPGLQWQLLARYIKRLVDARKLIAVVAGNHENWTVAVSGFDPLKAICRNLNVVCDPAEVTVTVNMAKAAYTIGVRHKYRFNSQLNPTNSVKRYWEFADCDWDVGVVCDKHEATVEPFMRHGRVRWAIRPGSYQTLSRFARSGGWPTSRPVTPCVVLRPDTYDLHGFDRLDWGLAAAAGLHNAVLRKRRSA